MEEKTPFRQCYMEIDLDDFPILWRAVLRRAINDYLVYFPGHYYYDWAEEWLFYENYDPQLDSFTTNDDAEDGFDLMSIWAISNAFNLDVEKLRFEVSRLKDLKNHGSCECEDEDSCEYCIEKMLSESGYAERVFDQFLEKCRK